MVVSEKIRLYPTKEQESLFFTFSNIARFTYNECLAYKNNLYQQEGYSCTTQDLIDHIKELKYSDEYSWLLKAPEAVTKRAIKDLDTAFKNFYRGTASFPKFKKKERTSPSFYVRSDKFRQIDETHIKITGIKTPVRMKKHAMFIQLLNPRITFDGKYWYLSYAFNIEPLPSSDSDKVIGVDIGIKSLAVTSDGTVYENINKTKRVRQLNKRLKHLQRKLSKKYEKNKQGNKYIKTNNILRLEKQIRLLHRKIRNIRDTYIHQVTYDLVRTKPKAIVIEELKVSNMLKNKHLSKAIQEQEFYKFRQYLTYKCKMLGVLLVTADTFYPSSKTCSCCGHKKKFLSLFERKYNCLNCGSSIDRDLNAAINLKNYYFNSKGGAIVNYTS